MNILIHLNKKVKCNILDSIDSRVVYTIEVLGKEVWRKSTKPRSTQKR